MTLAFDEGPLHSRGGVASRLRVIASDNLALLGATIGVLLVVVPLAVLVGLVATGNTGDTGALALIAMLVAGGLWTLVDVMRRAGTSSAVERFALVNGLDLILSTSGTRYAGSLFADGSHVVHQALRTRNGRFVEVGDMFRVAAPLGAAAGAVLPGQAATSTAPPPRLFLRARLAGHVRRTPADVELVTPELDAALSSFAGTHAIEVSGEELTVFGSRPLDPTGPGRIAEGFALAEALVGRADELLVDQPSWRADGVDVVPDGRRGRPWTPVRTVGALLAMLVVVPVLVAVVMSILDDGLRGNEPAARLVVGVLVLAIVLVVGAVVRASTGGRAARRVRPRSRCRRRR